MNPWRPESSVCFYLGASCAGAWLLLVGGCADPSAQPKAIDAAPTPRTSSFASALPTVTPPSATPSPTVVLPSPTPAPSPASDSPPKDFATPSTKPSTVGSETAPLSPEPPRRGGATEGATEEEFAPQPPERDLIELAQRLRPDSGEPIASARQSGTYEIGHTDTFFVTDLIGGSIYTVQATLKVVSEHAHWYADDAVDVSSDSLKAAADAFEGNIYPVVTRFFGDVGKAGDNGSRLTVLHTPLRGLSGYYSSMDEYPRQVRPYSNERKMLYMDSERLEAGTPLYLGVLAHELQHALHWSADHGEDAWVNEGMSEVAKELAGYDASFVGSFLERPATQLNYWPEQVGLSAPHYGAATLFLKFLARHYGGHEGLRSLVREPMDGIRGVESYLSSYGKTFLDVFRDWVVANYLGAAEGQYGYGDDSVRVEGVEAMTAFGQKTELLPQFSARYIDLRLDGDVLVEFEGDPLTTLVPTRCRSGRRCWWGNRGDSIDSVLTREFDLSGLTEATLEFWTWFSLEEGWDFAYVEVSTNDGDTWTILPGQHTTPEDPVGNSYGDGFTGKSEGWTQERIDLSPYIGQRVLLRFEYITDDSVYLDGFVIDDLAIPQLRYLDDVEEDTGWEASGFVRIEIELPQRYLVQVVEQLADGGEVVRQIGLDEDRKGETLIQGIGTRLTGAVIIVSPVTANTHQPARYTLTVSPDGGGD